MGAEAHRMILAGRSAAEAYGKAADDAAYEYGHGGYTGTIAESRGYVLAKPRTRWEADKAADRLLADHPVDGLRAEKWGHTVMIPILPSKGTREIVFALDVTGLENPSSVKWNDPDPFLVAAEEVAMQKARKDEHLLSLRYFRQGYTWQQSELVKRYAVKQKKAVPIRHDGVRKTRWAVVDSSERFIVHGVYDTLAEAKRRGAEDSIKMERGLALMQVINVDGGPAWHFDFSVGKETVAVRAQYGKPAAGEPKEWLAVGVYSS